MGLETGLKASELRVPVGSLAGARTKKISRAAHAHFQGLCSAGVESSLCFKALGSRVQSARGRPEVACGV